MATTPPCMINEARSGLAKKILAVMASVSRIPKRGTHPTQKYPYVMESDVLEALSDRMCEVGLVILPTLKAHSTERVGNANICHVDMAFEIVDTDTGYAESRDFSGAGIDAGEKAVYKGATGAHKYFLMKLFMVPSGDDPEAEAAPAEPARALPRAAIHRPAPPAASPTAAPGAAQPVRVRTALEASRVSFHLLLAKAVTMGLYDPLGSDKSAAGSAYRKSVRTELAGIAEPTSAEEWEACAAALREVVAMNTPPDQTGSASGSLHGFEA